MGWDVDVSELLEQGCREKKPRAAKAKAKRAPLKEQNGLQRESQPSVEQPASAGKQEDLVSVSATEAPFSSATIVVETPFIAKPTGTAEETPEETPEETSSVAGLDSAETVVMDKRPALKPPKSCLKTPGTVSPSPRKGEDLTFDTVTG